MSEPSRPISTDQDICVHGNDRRVTWCVWCEDPARMTGAARIDQFPVTFTIGPTINRVTMLDAPSHYDSIQASIWAAGYNKGYRDAANELRQEGASARATPSGSTGEERPQPPEASRDREAEGGEAPQEQGVNANESRADQETSSEIQRSGKSVLEGRGG